MKVTVLFNASAGQADLDRVRAALRRALFRCDIEVLTPTTADEMREAVRVHAPSSDALIICGGDGTLNVAIQPLFEPGAPARPPPILLLPVGTANDLAHELGLSHRLERAARLVLEGEPKGIDVIEIRSGEQVAHMLTAGGLGVAAETADFANRLRLRDGGEAAGARGLLAKAARVGAGALGPMLYETLLLGEMLGGATTYRLDRWCVDLEIDDAQQTKLTTRAPFIMVNNQPGLGGKYMPAPLTSNTDGVFNVLLVEAESIASQARVLLQMRAGRMPDSAAVRSFETKRAIFRAAPQARDLLFFGDGEILIRDAREIEVVCLPHALSVYVEREYGR